MWYSALNRIFQITLFVIWIVTLIYLFILSSLTFVILNIFLIIFLFWSLLTLCGWSLALIPILKFVFMPWYHRQCRLWTKNKLQKHSSVAFFHPYCKSVGSNEQVLWAAIHSILKKHRNDIQIIIYAGDNDITVEEILQFVKHSFGINMEIYASSITLIHLRTRFLIEIDYFKQYTSLGRYIGSMILSFEALIRFIPDIYIDFMGHAFSYPCIYYLASIPIISYVYFPMISCNLFEQINKENSPSNDNEFIIKKSLCYKIKLLSYQIYSYVYGWCGRCSNIVYCNSSWTKTHIESIWNLSHIYVVYPSCNIQQFLELPTDDTDERMFKTIVSIGEFRRENNHQLQIQAFNQLLQKKPDYRQTLKLILIGSLRDDADRKYFEQLKSMIDTLDMKQEVIFKLNINFEELKSQLNQAIIGLNTVQNEYFDIGLVEMMAAGVIVILHKSNGLY